MHSWMSLSAHACEHVSIMWGLRNQLELYIGKALLATEQVERDTDGVFETQ